MNRASEHNLVALLDKWSTCWKHRGRTRAIGPHAYEKYSTLGFFGHGGGLWHFESFSNETGVASRHPEHDRTRTMLSL